MKHRTGFLILSAAVLCLLFSSRSVYPYSYSAWGSMTGAKTFAVNPFFYGGFDPEFSLTTELVVGYGFSEVFDIYADLATLDLTPDSGYGGSWVMPRYDLGGNNILALQIGFYKEEGSTASYIVPQYHLYKDGEIFTWEINLGLNVPLDDAGSSLLYGVVAPVWKIVPNTLNLFLEIDPSYQMGDADDFILTLVPGLCLGFGNEGQHQFCLGFPVSDLTENEVSTTYAAWFWTSF
ncbi:MAG: hypothetical protein PHF84_08685 [bacterium]|nr:hypothetical protein [bacterium]